MHAFRPCPLIMWPSAKDENITFWSLSNSCWLYFVISVCSPRAACSLHTWNIRESCTNAKVDNRGSSSMFASANKNESKIKQMPRERESMLIWICEILPLQQITYKEQKWKLNHLLSEILFRHFLHYLRRITTESIITVYEWNKSKNISKELKFVHLLEKTQNAKLRMLDQMTIENIWCQNGKLKL